MAEILDGNRVRDAILRELSPRVAALPRPPGLAVVLVGHDPASEVYVRNKVKACAELGIYSETMTPPATIQTADLLAIIQALNERAEIDGERKTLRTGQLKLMADQGAFNESVKQFVVAHPGLEREERARFQNYGDATLVRRLVVQA